MAEGLDLSRGLVVWQIFEFTSVVDNLQHSTV